MTDAYTMYGGYPMSKKDRVSYIRETWNCGLLEAKRIVAKEMILEEIDAAESVDDLKAILRQLVDHSW